ncbi:MAG: low temperature requirement protein A, partial [Rhodoglobus sp.]
TYSAATALIWIASIWVPQPAQYFVWAATIVIEIALLGIRRVGGLRLLMDQMALDHLAERMGLFTLIVLGESLIVTVTGVSDQWTAIVGATAVLGFVLIGSIAWTFLIQTTVAIEHGLRGLRERRDARGMRDTVMYLPYFLVVGITLLSTGLGTAVSHPEHPLPIGAAVALGGGLGLYYVTNLVVGMRYGQLTVGALVWTLASAAVALLLIPVSSLISAIVAVAWAAVIVVANVVFANVKRAALSGL